MAFVERLKIILDMEGDNVTKGLRGIGKEISAADGFVNKFKAGVNGVKSSIGEFLSSGAGMATATAAVGAAMFGAANKAADLGMEIGKLSDATGLSAESASRWTEVANDLGIGSDQVAGLIEKMTKNLGATPEKFEAMGISIQKAANGTVDMNATLLEAIAVIQKIPDPTKRAKAAADLFGKGWADAAELVSMSATELKDRLEGVSEAKVFNEEEIKQAREFRDSMEDLKDVGEDLAIAVGKDLIPQMVQFIDVLMSAKNGLEDLNDWTKKASGSNDGLIDTIERAVNPMEGAKSAWEDVTDLFSDDEPQKKAAEAVELVATGYGDMTDATDEARDAMFGAEGAWKGAAKGLDGLTRAQERVKRATDKTTEAYEFQMGLLDASDSYHNIALALSDIEDQVKANNEAVADGSMTWEEAMHANAIVMNDAKKAVKLYGDEILNLPPEALTKVEAAIDRGAYDEALRLIEALSRPRTVVVSTSVNGSSTTTASGSGGNTGGLSGSNPSPGSIVQESISGSGRGSGVTVNVYAGVGTDGNAVGVQIADVLTKWWNDGGRAAWTGGN